MATKNSPLGRTKEAHESKEKLVDKVVTLLGRITHSDESSDNLKARLLAASNKKLLRLFEIGSEIQKQWGSMEKMAEAAATAVGRAKDAPYVAKLKTFTPAKLFDFLRAAERRKKKAA
jgi:hypothetical protein